MASEIDLADAYLYDVGVANSFLTVVHRLENEPQQDRLVVSARLVLEFQQERDDVAVGERDKVDAADVVGRLQLFPHPIRRDNSAIILNATPHVESSVVVVGELAGSDEVEPVVGAGLGSGGGVPTRGTAEGAGEPDEGGDA